MEAMEMKQSDAPGKADYQHEVRGRQVGVNGRLKRFRVLTTLFSHNKDHHDLCFFAVPNIVQVVINVEEPLFDIAAPGTDAEVQYEDRQSGL